MGWQEELRNLDVELAGGRITHDVHRKLRDELLAGASGGYSPSPMASPLRNRDTGEKPVPAEWQTQPPHQTPAAAPARPTVPAVPAVMAVPPTSSPPFTTEHSTSAPSPADFRATDSMAYPSGPRDRLDGPTVVLPAVMPLPPVGSPHRARPRQTSPTAVPFPSPPPNRSRPTWLFLAAGVVLVLALIGGGVWWIGPGADDDAPQAAPPPPSSQAPPAAAVSPSAPIEDLVATPPGTPNKNNSTLSIAKGSQLDLYPAKAAQVFTANGATKVVYRASADGTGPDAYFILVLPTKSPHNAQAVVDYLGKGALSGGFEKTSDDQLTVAGVKDDRSMTGTWYASGDVAVTVWVSQPAQSKANLVDKLDQMLTSLRHKLPAR